MALRHQYEFILKWMQISHDPKDLEKLYNACHFGDADLAIGSRYVTGVNVVNPLSRVLLSYLLQYMCVTGMKIHDATAGFVSMFKKST
jgi:dolichol-phosphate mannosyltransferase